MEHSGLHWSTEKQSKFIKGNWYYWILQMGKEKRNVRPAIVIAGDCNTADLKEIGPLIEICVSQPKP